MTQINWRFVRNITKIPLGPRFVQKKGETTYIITYLKDKVRYKVRVRVFFKAITYLNNVGSIT